MKPISLLSDYNSLWMIIDSTQLGGYYKRIKLGIE